MGKQILVSISREFGSEGHLIAERVAKDLGIALYDRNLLDAIAEEKHMKVEHWEKYDETSKNFMLTRTVKGHSNSMADHLVDLQFEFLQKKAESGESFVVVGRCGEEALKEYDGLISIFVLGNKKEKIAHVMEKFKLSEREALAKMVRHDRKRKFYHNYYSENKWGDSRGYDLCINSSTLGLDKTVKVIEEFIKESME